MRLLYLSRNMDVYTSSMYQREIMAELASRAEMVFYGPGYEGYSEQEDIKAILDRIGKVDAVVMGHAWLSDTAGQSIDPHPALGLEHCALPKIVFLNKEYVNLPEKLQYIGRRGFHAGLTHHHETEVYAAATGIPFTFIPFGFDHRLFGTKQEEEIYDFAFSGVLQNLNETAQQSDIRARIQKRLFHCLGDVPLCRRRAWSGVRLFWNAIPRTRNQVRLARLFGRYRYLPAKEYSALQGKSKVYLNTLSPMKLVSPRFFENMASKALVLCEESEVYPQILPDGCYVTFRSDLLDFDETLRKVLRDGPFREEIVERAYAEVMRNHTWERRVDDVMQVIEQLVGAHG